MVTHTFNLNTWEAEAGVLCEFKASLINRASSRTARAVTQRNPVSERNRKINSDKTDMT